MYVESISVKVLNFERVNGGQAVLDDGTEKELMSAS